MKKKQKQKQSLIRHYATFVEYAMLAGLIAIIVAAAVMLLGGKLKEFFGQTSEQVGTLTTEAGKTDLKGAGGK